MKKFALIAAAAMTAAWSAPAFAGESDAAHEAAVQVWYGDLNLQQNHDAGVMLSRLHEAALQACGASSFSLREYRWAVGRSACFHQSLDRAVAQLDAPNVTRLYESGRTLAMN